MNPEEQQQLEQFVAHTLRGQPPVRAPETLQVRVLEHLERRAHLPWWRESFARWPVVARALFLVAAVGAARLVWMAPAWLRGTSVLEPATDLPAQVTALHTIASAMLAALQNFPTLWVYGALAALALLYSALFGLTAMAWRTLYTQKSF